MKRSNSIRPFALALSLWIVGGCGQISRLEQDRPAGPDTIVADCVVNYFQNGRMPYITQQRHLFDPAAGYFEIIANEPSGLYNFTLTKEKFTSEKQLSPFLSALPASFVNQPLTVALFYSFTTGAGLLDTSEFSTSEIVKIEGQWYQPIELYPHPEIHVTLLKNNSTNRIELLKIQEDASNILWLVKSYNIRYNKELDTLVPMKIDIFDIRNGLASKQLIIQIDYKNIVMKNPKQDVPAEKTFGN